MLCKLRTVSRRESKIEYIQKKGHKECKKKNGGEKIDK